MNVVFDHKVEEAPGIVSFFFKADSAPDYVAGQFIQLHIPHENPDNRGQKHWFTLSSSPTQSLLSITTRFSPDKVSTFKQTLRNLAPGSSVNMSAPMGDFVLPKDTETPLIFVAAGIGITPFHSILTWLHDGHQSRPIKLLYAVNNEDEIIFQETFRQAGVHATIVVSNASPAWGGERGHLSAEMIIGLEEPSAGTLIYISGPEPLVEMLEADLLKAGIKKDRLVLDFFPNYSVV